MHNLLADVRYALRSLLAQPAFSITAVLTLALGIGVTTAIYGVVNGIVLRPLAFPNAERLITICEEHPAATKDWCSISPPNVEDLAARSHTIEAIGIGRSWPYHLATVEGAQAVNGGIATPGLFRALGVRPELGRLIGESDMLGRESDVVLLSYEMWQARFGSARDVVGRVIVLDGKPVTIIGVLPAGFQLPKYDDIQLWRPLHINPRDEEHREWRGFVAYARLRPGVSLATAQAELTGIAGQLRREHFTKTAGWDLQMESLQDLVVGSAKPILLFFLGAVSLILLIGCANVANLLLARAGVRAREMALRSALGASRWRIVRALLVESFVLSLAGTSFGVLIAVWGTAAFKALAPPSIPRISDVTIDARVLFFALALAVVTTVLFGLAPALRAARTDLAESLREGGRGMAMGSSVLGRLLVIGELALALVLVAGAGLLTRSFAAITAWNPGFEREHVQTFSLFAPAEQYAGEEKIAALWDRVEMELAALPGVRAVGSASGGPLFGGVETDEVHFESRGGGVRAAAWWYDVSPSFFATLGVPLVQGRPLQATDRLSAPRVALVNESLAKQFWPGDTPIGKELSLFQDRYRVQVVGVVRDIAAVTPGQRVQPQIYWSNRQAPRGFTYFVLRTAVPPATVMSDVRARLRAIDPDLQASNVNTMPELMGRKLKTPRFQMLLLVSFGMAALLLAAIGTYGLFAYRVSRRTREIGIRIALGAARHQIVSAVVREGLSLAAAGTVIGIAGAILATRAMHGMIVGVSAFDPVTLGVSAALLVAVAILACLGPARRAASVDPAITLAAD